MTETLLSNVVVPIAGPDDASATCAAALPHVAADGGSITAIFVVEKAGGGIDKTSVEQREEYAAEAFDVVEAACADAGVDCETDIVYGTDVVDAIIEAAHERNASAIVFSPRKGSRWLDLITGDRSSHLVKESDLPVVVFPANTDT